MFMPKRMSLVSTALALGEESPFTRRKAMGSRVYAGECRRRRENIIGMICLEAIGCYVEEVGSQWLSFGGLFLPRREDFLALVANPASKNLLRQVSATIAQQSALHIRSVILPTYCPGAWSSDHWSLIYRYLLQLVEALA